MGRLRLRKLIDIKRCFEMWNNCNLKFMSYELQNGCNLSVFVIEWELFKYSSIV